MTLLANSKTPGFTPETGLSMLQTRLDQDYFMSGGGLSFLQGSGAERDAVGALFELFASKLGGSFPTFIPIDQLWGERPVPAVVSKQNMVAFVSDIDLAVSQMAGKAPSTWLSNLPQLFSLSQPDRTALGWTAQDDPTNGISLEAFATSGDEYGATIVNPICELFDLRQRLYGTTTAAPDQHDVQFTVSGPGTSYTQTVTVPPGFVTSTEVYSPGQTGTPPQGMNRLTKDGLYTTSVCLADTGSCGQQVVQSEFLVDVSGWTNNALVVMSPGAKLSLAPAQAPYTLTYIGGGTDVVAIGNLPSVYAEVALTDGTVTRLFPWMPTAPNSNIWNWAPFDNPKVLVPLNAVTWDPLITPKNQVSRGGWITLDTLGANHGDPDFTKLVNGDFPVTAGVNAWGSTRAVFSLNGQTWNCAMNYVGANQVNVQVCPDLPVGQTVNVQVSVNGVLSNSWPLQVVADTPDIFMVNSGGYTVPAVTFATGPKLGQVVTPANPAPKGQALSLYYTGCGTLSEAQQAGVPAPLDHLVYATDPSTLLVGTAQAQILFNGLAPGYVGLCQMNFVVPGLPAFTTGGNVSSMSIGLTIGGNPANSVVLSVQ
jgi:uncharacterized protein (TIGR03437 family)